MQGQSIERAWIDPDTAPQDGFRITHLTDASDTRWTGIIDLGPFASTTLDTGLRHDLYVLRGELETETEGHPLHAGDFLTQCTAAHIRAGKNGARLLVYREASGSQCNPAFRRAQERVWRDGVNPRMQVAALASGSHHVSLVAWQPGAVTRNHAHPSGEEIFVLSGEIRDSDERHAAGTWLRLHPGATHAPFAEVPAVILLRHGHLRHEA